MCASLWCTAPLCAAAQPNLLLVLDAGSAGHAAFLTALRIQLGDTYVLHAQSLSFPASLADRVARASELVSAQQALAAVWMEDTAGGRAVRRGVLYVVSRRDGRALVELVQVPSARGPDLSRALALKLSELLGELQSQPEPAALSADMLRQPALPPPLAASAEAPPPAAASSEPPPSAAEAASEPEPTPSRFWASGRAGPRLDFGSAANSGRVGLGAQLTPEWTQGRLRVGLGVGADWYPQRTRESVQGSVSMREVSPRVLLSIAWQTWLCDVGAHTAGVLNLVSARGRTPAGRIGDSSDQVVGWALGVHAERNLFGPLGVVLFVEAQPQLERVYFRVNDETVIDRGRLRITWGLDLRLRTELSSAQRSSP